MLKRSFLGQIVNKVVVSMFSDENMNQLKRFWLLLQTIGVIAIFLQSPFATASSYNWELTYPYFFTYNVEDETHIFDTSNNLVQDISMNNIEEHVVNITSVDLNSGKLTYYLTIASITQQYTTDFLMNDYLAVNMLTNLFSFFYTWDYDRNTTVLLSFDCHFDAWYFLEPNWPVFNNHLKMILNASEVIYQVPDPYEPIVHNITFGDFLASLPAYSLNGKSTLEGFKSQLKSTTRRWTFSFDLSNVLYDSYYNFTLGRFVFFPITKYEPSYSLEYSKDGIMQENIYSYKMEFTSPDGKQITVDRIDKYIFGPKESLSAGLAILFVFPALLISALPMLLKKSKGVDRSK
ncbi:MAG: hypothetical protein K9W42_14190 [Candidatus Heimdallarchaeota archaeon]|nr:hypothetical protein [Candidatus Heimdallarchaeota archaeon]